MSGKQCYHCGGRYPQCGCFKKRTNNFKGKVWKGFGDYVDARGNYRRAPYDQAQWEAGYKSALKIGKTRNQLLDMEEPGYWDRFTHGIGSLGENLGKFKPWMEGGAKVTTAFAKGLTALRGGGQGGQQNPFSWMSQGGGRAPATNDDDDDDDGKRQVNPRPRIVDLTPRDYSPEDEVVEINPEEPDSMYNRIQKWNPLSKGNSSYFQGRKSNARKFAEYAYKTWKDSFENKGRHRPRAPTTTEPDYEPQEMQVYKQRGQVYKRPKLQNFDELVSSLPPKDVEYVMSAPEEEYISPYKFNFPSDIDFSPARNNLNWSPQSPYDPMKGRVRPMSRTHAPALTKAQVNDNHVNYLERIERNRKKNASGKIMTRAQSRVPEYKSYSANLVTRPIPVRIEKTISIPRHAYTQKIPPTKFKKQHVKPYRRVNTSKVGYYIANNPYYEGTPHQPAFQRWSNKRQVEYWDDKFYNPYF